MAAADQSMMQTDAIVIGAGPTGLTAACVLADAGLTVALVEAKPGSGDEPRAISATDETLRVMQQLGVLDRLAPEMLLDTGARYTGLKGQVLADVRPTRPRLGQPGKSQFDQPVMEGLLYEAVRERPNIQRVFGAKAVGLEQDAESVTLTVEARPELADGFRGDLEPERLEIVLGTPTQTMRIRAQWLIGCDGGKSYTRKALNIPLEGSTQVEKWIVIDVLGAGDPEPFATFHCNGTRPCVVVPGVNGRRRYEFMLFPEDDQEAIISPAGVRELVAPYQSLEGVTVRRAAVYTAQQRLAAQWRKGRVVLAGDAAHLMPPFAGQGLNAGIRDAVAAAWRVAAIVSGVATGRVLDSYEPERRTHAGQMVKLSKRIGSIVMSRNRAVCIARDLAVPGLGIVPSVKSWVTGMKFLKQPDYSEGLAVQADKAVPDAARALLGKSVPQPDVLDDDGAVRKLDELLGDNFAWVQVPAPGRLRIFRADREPITVRTVGGQVDPSLFDGAAGYSLLIRPDRYVAAVTRIGAEGDTVGRLRSIVPGLERIMVAA